MAMTERENCPQRHWTLASASPRRAELLRSALDSFDIVVSPKPEPVRKPASVEMEVWPVCLAHYKAKAVSALIHSPHQSPQPWGVIGADTIVEINGHAINKAHNAAHARRILQSISGKMHRVITGVAIIINDRTHLISAIALCRMRRLTPSMLDRYIATGLWRGKAGAYGIQDADDPLVEIVSGDTTTVMGLPMPPLLKLLNRVESDNATQHDSPPAC